MTKASTYGEAVIDIAFDMLGSFVWELPEAGDGNAEMSWSPR